MTTELLDAPKSAVAEYQPFYAQLAELEASNAHRAKTNRAALAALVAGGISEDCGKECIKLVASGKVPAVQINY